MTQKKKLKEAGGLELAEKDLDEVQGGIIVKMKNVVVSGYQTDGGGALQNDPTDIVRVDTNSGDRT